jgi:hypothetical protein
MIFADILMWFFLITGTYVVLISYWLTSQGLFPAFVDRCRKRIESSPVRQALLGLSVTVPLAATGIVMLNAEAAKLAQNAAERATMEASLAEHVKTINALLDPHEQLECLVVISTAWSVDNGFITPTFKVKRNRIEEVYAPMFERWVGARRLVVWHQG